MCSGDLVKLNPKLLDKLPDLKSLQSAVTTTPDAYFLVSNLLEQPKRPVNPRPRHRNRRGRKGKGPEAAQRNVDAIFVTVDGTEHKVPIKAIERFVPHNTM